MTEHRDGKGNLGQDSKRASEAGKKGTAQSGASVKSDPQKASQSGQKDSDKSRRS